ncbi:MAG: hypothetical protein L3J28_05110, partial [Candidatus Polarisedimenticolaceae bacterium]|nr:hypothetical protein [Candidatus Polarisedimenticolaceae bacterium]
MALISTSDIEPERKLFHNEWLNVYQTVLSLDQIDFWEENNRTIFTFERLLWNKGKSVRELSIDELTNYIGNYSASVNSVLTAHVQNSGRSPLNARPIATAALTPCFRQVDR